MTYAGEVVALSAAVDEAISPAAFTIAGTEDTTVSPLLVISDQQVADLDEGQLIQVTGTVHEAFDLPTVEEQAEQDLDDERFTDHDGQSYNEATTVSTDIPAR